MRAAAPAALAVLLAAVPARAVEPSTGPITAELVAARFAELDASMKTLSADLRQVLLVEGAGAPKTVEGTLEFRAPDRLRLVHRLPEPQTVVSDGEWLWVHRTATKQVLKTRLEAWRKSEPLARGLLDLGRTAQLLERYAASVSTVSAPGPDGHRDFVLLLKPKTSSEPPFTLKLRASTRDFLPVEVVLSVDRARVRTLLTNVRLNPDLPAERFRFEPPPDAEVFAAPTTP